MTLTSVGSDSRIDGEAVVLRGDLDLAGLELLDRMIGAAVAELQLVGLAAHRERQDLVAEADAEHRHVGLDQLARVVDRVPEHGGIARAVAQEHAVGDSSASRSDAGAVAGNTRTSQP